MSGQRSEHERLLALWTAGWEARLYVDEIRQTGPAGSVAQAIWGHARQTGVAGVFHWAEAEPVARFKIG